MPTLFISDLHLSPERPDMLAAFHGFLRGPASDSESLYVLGDLFEYWLGDDQLGDAFAGGVADGFAGLARKGVGIYLQHGNRDFLLGEEFATRAAAMLLPEYHAIDLYGISTLLMHGDQLCTDDTAYQALRAQVRDPAWKRNFLGLPFGERRHRAQLWREQSEAAKSGKPAAIMDVNELAVAQCLRRHDYPRLIHGHTHRPARHEQRVDGHICERYVLADWYEHASYLRAEPGALLAVALPEDSWRER